MALLVALDALLGERSVTGAAKRLGISQPAMSAQLGRLRALLDDPVLVGGASGMAPTVRMLALQEPLRQHLADLRDLVFAQRPFEPTEAKRTFRIAATDYAHAVVLPALIARLARLAPGIRVAGLPFNEATVSAQLESGAADLAITSERLIPKAIPARKLFEDRVAVVWRRGHPEVRAPMDLDLFCALDQLLVSPTGGGFSGAVDDALAKINRSRRVVGSLPSFLLAPAALRRSDCLAVLPRRVIDLDRTDLDHGEPPIPIPGFATYQGWHARFSRDPGHLWLRETIADLIDRDPPLGQFDAIQGRV